MHRKNGKKRLQVRLAVYLLFLCLCTGLTACTAGPADRDVRAEETEEPGGRGVGEKAEADGKVTDRERGGLDVWFFSCSDDADSILLQVDETNVIIDTGLEEDAGALAEKLKALDVERIDLMILTHPDKDHIGGAGLLLDTFEVGQIIQTACIKDSVQQNRLNRKLEQESVLIPEEKQEFDYGKLHLTLFPPREAEYEEANNYSIALLAEYEGRTFFFAGDAKKKRMKELLEEELPEVDVYKAACHGRDGGKSRELLACLSPCIVVVTAQEAEKKMDQALTEAGAEVYTTFGQDIHMTVTNGVLDVR